ncbi:hypothetical protein ACF0H5_016264 [Mactra antiquata]
MWSSRDLTDWLVHYGTSQEEFNFIKNSAMFMLPDDHNNSARYIYKAELHRLEYGKQYFYKIVSEQSPDIQSSVFSFKTLDPKKDRERSLRFITYGDMGSTRSAVTVKSIQQYHDTHPLDAILHIGDFAYDLMSDSGKVGDDFMKEIQPIASTIPYMTSPGNHEIPGDFLSYRIRFSAPGIDWPMPLNKLWYSFDIGLVHFISYSTEVYFTYMESSACEQFDWLKADLEKANQNRDKTPWVIAFGHRPMYCSNTVRDDCSNATMRRWVKQGLEPLFHAFGVDLVLQAHEHSYERLYPLVNGIVERFNYTNPRAPVHVITGAAGSMEGTNFMRRDPEYWSAVQQDKVGFNSYGVLDIINRTHIRYTQIEATDNSTLDSFILQQDNHGPFVHGASCQNGHSNLHYCSCILPLQRIIIGVVLLAVVAILLIVCVILGVYYSSNRCNKNKMAYKKFRTKHCFKSCCFTYRHRFYQLPSDERDSQSLLNGEVC